LYGARCTHNVELSRTKPKDQEAYEVYLRSQNGPYWTVARNKEAIAMLEKSVALDPGYAPAWLALGLHYSTEATSAKAAKKCTTRLSRRCSGRMSSIRTC
jgi:tetratricopeptide (TPR) repeat protein